MHYSIHTSVQPSDISQMHLRKLFQRPLRTSLSARITPPLIRPQPIVHLLPSRPIIRRPTPHLLHKILHLRRIALSRNHRLSPRSGSSRQTHKTSPLNVFHIIFVYAAERRWEEVCESCATSPATPYSREYPEENLL